MCCQKCQSRARDFVPKKSIWSENKIILVPSSFPKHTKYNYTIPISNWYSQLQTTPLNPFGYLDTTNNTYTWIHIYIRLRHQTSTHHSIIMDTISMIYCCLVVLLTIQLGLVSGKWIFAVSFFKLLESNELMRDIILSRIYNLKRSLRLQKVVNV